jgi:hypothetical protein
MAGAKETPRQKMIGMMYLVLTALLALNVSKSILDAFVAIEENIQKANLAELFRGDERKGELIEAAADFTNPDRARKAKLLKVVVAEIDAMTRKRIELIDRVKLEILEACGEDVDTKGGKLAILMDAGRAQNGLRPLRMNLSNVQGQDKYDEVMHLLIGEDICKPQGRGMEIWKSVLSFRKALTEKIATTQLGADGASGFEKGYHFTAPEINSFSSQEELDQRLRKAIKQAKVHPEDEAMILEIYKSLTKEEYSTVHEIEDVHWIGKTFDHAPVVAALASLSSLQNDILAARADALTLIRNRVGGSDFSFNKVFAMATGPEVVNVGDEVEMRIMMVAFDSDKQPSVTMNGAQVNEVRDGQAKVSFKAQGQEMHMQGTVSVKTKSGQTKTLPWEKDIRVMQPSGSIELPQLNVLYRGYDNIVRVSASGYESAELGGNGVSISRSGDGYVVKTNGSGRTVQLSVIGKSSNGKTAVLRKTDFRVLNLPDPTLYWGAVKSGGNVPADLRIFAKLGPEVPLNANFQILRWELSTGDRPVSGTGNDLSAAQQFIRAVPKGRVISVKTWVQDPAKIQRIIMGAFAK